MSATRRDGRVSGVSSAAAPPQVAERRAQENAQRYASGRAMSGAASRGTDRSALTRNDELFAGDGRALDASERADMEPRFGRDFSHVRVHANSAAAGRMGARAFTHGKDIGFAPGESPEADRELLAHELTHADQQETSVTPQVQMEPKPGKGGIGSTPPSEPFERSDKTGIEDDAVRFSQNDASLSAGDLAALRKLAQGRTSPVTVEVHGYASEEGDADYNVNLSAHRAAAVKTALRQLLPQGSTFVLVAHGMTKAFGETEENRRAGIRIVPPAATPAAAVPPTLAPTKGDAPTSDIHLDPARGGFRLLNPPTMPLAPYSSPMPFTLPPLRTAAPIDWLAMRGKWNSYGLDFDARTAGDIEGYALRQRNATIGFGTIFLGLTPYQAGELADKLQPIALGVATGAYLSNNYPNQGDLLDRDVKAAHPDSWKTPQVPVLTILELLSRKYISKDANLTSF